MVSSVVKCMNSGQRYGDGNDHDRVSYYDDDQFMSLQSFLLISHKILGFNRL